MSKERQYASIENPSIAAIVTGSYSFSDRTKAIERLELTHKYFVTAKKTHKAPDGGPGFLIWIKGFAVTPENEKQGIVGNFAHVYINKNEKNRHSLVACKVESEVKNHPMRSRPKQSHPDWGNPIMRSVKKRKLFKTLQEAQEDLNLLHETFPDATIPTPGKLNIMVYERKEDKTPPIQKYIFEIKIDPNGEYFIEYNKKKPKESTPKPEQKTSPQGYFTGKEELKRAKKKKQPLIPAHKNNN